jgi:hypothetical protein
LSASTALPPSGISLEDESDFDPANLWSLDRLCHFYDREAMDLAVAL